MVKIQCMLKKIKLPVYMRLVSIMVFIFTIQAILFSQTVLFKGVIKDERTLMPIQDVNIKVYGTTKGTSTDHAGNFSLKISKIPATMIFTCVGYEVSSYNITDGPQKTVEFLLRPKLYTLEQVDISSKKYSYLFNDKDYSVLDYAIMGDNVLILIFRYQLKKSELVLLSRDGDTLAISKLPEVPPTMLFKDFLGNVHYFSKANNSYHCFFNSDLQTIDYLYKTTVDSLISVIKPYIFKLSDRLYFQETMTNGFGTAFGFYEKDAEKKYIRQYFNESKSSEYSDDQVFYKKWNNFIARTRNLSNGNFIGGQFYDEYETRAHQVFFWNMIYPVIKTGDDNIAFFNFSSNFIDLMTQNGKTIETVPIVFHKETLSKTDSTTTVNLSEAGWRWGSRILVDDYDQSSYTIFLRGGMFKIQKIDMQTGKLSPGTVLPFLFPEKIEIYRGNAYFLIKSDGLNDKWKLIKCKI